MKINHQKLFYQLLYALHKKILKSHKTVLIHHEKMRFFCSAFWIYSVTFVKRSSLMSLRAI